MNENDIVKNQICTEKVTRKYTVFTIETILEQSSSFSSSENSSSEDDEKAEKVEVDFASQNESEKLKKRSRTSFSGKVHRHLASFLLYQSPELIKSDQVAALEDEFQQNKDRLNLQ